jgi:glycosyltransferase involved in cell wall biosynthesis
MYRMLIVDHAVEMGGAEIILLDFLDRLHGDLFEPRLACPHEGPLTNQARHRNIYVYLGHPSPRLLKIKRASLGDSGLTALAYPLDLLRSAARLAGLIRRERFDLVLTNSAKAHIYGSLAGFLARVPVVWRIHDIVDERAFSRLNRFLIRTCASLFSSKVMAISGAVKDALVALGVRGDKVVIVYNGVPGEAGATAEKRKEARSSLCIDERDVLAGFVGRLVDWKGPDYFIKAAALACREMPGARFVIVGDAIYGERDFASGLRDLSSSLGLEDKMAFTGFMEDVGGIMSGMDVLVHTSVLPEPFGLVIAEAMMHGLPVIATEGGAVREIVEDGVTGLVVPPRREDVLAAAMLEVMGDPARARQMGESGRKRAREMFDADIMTENMEKELLDAVEGRGRRRNASRPGGKNGSQRG